MGDEVVVEEPPMREGKRARGAGPAVAMGSRVGVYRRPSAGAEGAGGRFPHVGSCFDAWCWSRNDAVELCHGDHGSVCAGVESEVRVSSN
jgi:hypothetical protein